MVSGNYYKPTGIGFGGLKQASSVSQLLSLLQREGLTPRLEREREKEREREMDQERENQREKEKESEREKDGEEEREREREKVEKLVVIDVHTGLGRKGVDTLAISNLSLSLSHSLSIDEIEGMFPTEYGCGARSKLSTGGVKSITRQKGGGALAGYDLTEGDTCTGLTRSFLMADYKLCVLQEFGTISTVTVGERLIMENYAHHHAEESGKEYFGQLLKEAFYLSDDLQW
eukprot:CAMPEP_0182420250 /NCGR_PEP_ID=MMETSP1167-20130531/4914_1 /TAXON_ID=2988 /ORGANISM="Mallomonas Sp, Strain CCMP3275" /LENGTH=230 /DNA_ID=CAMNT_0024595961 /DNA_START=671 /DNA_END=1360 /DNA_ORIENTATION=+